MSISQYVMKERTEAIATTRADNAMPKKTATMLMGPVYWDVNPVTKGICVNHVRKLLIIWSLFCYVILLFNQVIYTIIQWLVFFLSIGINKKIKSHHNDML